MKFPFPFKSNEILLTTTTAAAASSSAWPWPSCATTPRTLSFRRADDFYKTTSPAYLDDTPHQSLSPHHETRNPESAVISGLRSERLFFEPGATSSIVAEAKRDDEGGGEPESVAMVVMDSRNPFLDFRVSMAEMVEACGARDWEFLEELLEWYLRVNDETNHGYIVEAFVDLLISAIDDQDSSSSLSYSSSSAATKYSFNSPLSFSSSSSSTVEDVVVHKNV